MRSRWSLLLSRAMLLVTLLTKGASSKETYRVKKNRDLEGTGESARAPSPAPRGELTDVTSYFNLELETRDGNPDDTDISNALHLLLETYNELVTTKYENPQELQMDTATVTSYSDARRRRQRHRNLMAEASNDETRQLQNLNILLFLRVSGRCRGCPSDSFFTNQVVRKKRRRELYSDDLPTEAELLAAYSARLSSSSEDFGSIEDVVDLDEVPPPSAGKGKGKGGSSKKSGSASKGKGGSAKNSGSASKGKGKGDGSAKMSAGSASKGKGKGGSSKKSGSKGKGKGDEDSSTKDTKKDPTYRVGPMHDVFPVLEGGRDLPRNKWRKET